VSAIPDRDGFLDPLAVDRLLLTVHWEMQRLAEEFFHGQRVSELLGTVLSTLRAEGFKGPLRVVDVGCGIGYVVRWLAARTALPSQGVELVGVDLNSTLIREATRLATAEKLPCRFLHGDAFSRDHAGHIYLSTGFVHHFRADALHQLLRRHDLEDTAAFLHYDFRPWLLAPFGSWFFHILRMRTAIARHDGVLSTVRAHSGETLVRASRAALPSFS
jgi:SAM-dependent methyltransferase